MRHLRREPESASSSDSPGDAAQRCETRARATAVRMRGGGISCEPPCGPLRGRRGRRLCGWWLGARGPERGPMPPFSPLAGSGAWRTAQRTSRKRATIGIFKISINQTNVQASTFRSYTPLLLPTSPRGSALQAGERGAAEAGDLAQLAYPCGDFLAREPLDPLGAELLDVERSERRSMRHSASQ